MEIPIELKQLYKHWQYHTKVAPPTKTDTNLYDIPYFITERMKIWERKYTNQQLPYTKDKILQTYRFCNIYRELDKQTIQIHTNLKHLTIDFSLWLLNIAYSRFVCNPNTIEKTGLLSFDKNNNEKVFNILKTLPSPKYGTAYIFPISTIQKSEYPTREDFFCKYLPLVIPTIANKITEFERIGVSEALKKILPLFGFNMYFHWTEILIDTAYQYPEYIDLFKQFPIGPGSMPTMKKLSSDNPELTCLDMVKNKIEDFPYLTYNHKPVYLSAENWEGIGCEYRKYCNLRNGVGRKRKYI